ncbi:MAG: hypothetical protein ACR2MG_02410 [Pyrinomonadaceae bacterium]
MDKSVAEKMGIEQNARSIFINAPEDAIKAIELPDINLEKKLAGHFDYIHFFVISRKDFHNEFPILKSHLKKTGSLWVSWQKSGKNNTDLNMKSVIKIGYEYGLVESKCISINSTWSALKFTHPKKGKIYKNSYGELKI